MKRLDIRMLAIGITLAIIIGACKKNKESVVSPVNPDTSSAAPVETKAPNSNYKPAFAGP